MDISRAFLLVSLIFGSYLPVHAGGTFACGGTLSVIREGHNVAIPDSKSLQLMEDLQTLLQSCSVDSSTYVETEQRWIQALKSDSYIHYSVAKGTAFHLSLGGQIAADVEEVLLPLPKTEWPDHIFVKHNGHVRAYTKYSPLALKAIVSLPEINLISRSPYDSLQQLPAPKPTP